MDLAEVMSELEPLGTEQTKKTYRNHEVPEPLFGVTSRDMRPLARKIKRDHALAMELYATGNYDAAYLAGMITEPKKMSESGLTSEVLKHTSREMRGREENWRRTTIDGVRFYTSRKSKYSEAPTNLVVPKNMLSALAEKIYVVTSYRCVELL